MEVEPVQRQYRSMNSHNPNPADGQQSATPSDEQPGPRDPHRPSEPADAGRPAESPRESAGPQTEPLLPPPLYGPHELPGIPSGGPAAAGAQPAQQLDFFGWVRSHGVYRGRDRWIGGVSSGIAQRMGIDPLIVRGIFIVLTLFAGIGVLLYGLGWALLPEPDGRIHTQEAGAGRWTTGMTGALVTTILGLTGMGGGFWGWGRDGFGFFWALFWIGGLIYLVYYLTQRNRNSGGAVSHNASGSPYAPGIPYGGGNSASGGFGSVPPRGPAPVPAPGPAPKQKPGGPGTPAVAITAGLALLVGGSLKALDAGNVIDLGTSANAIVWASGAAVLGLGILLAGLRGRSSGVLGFFAVVALIVGGVFNAVPNGDRFRFHDADWTPASIEQARDGFQITGGRGTVDLTGLNLEAPLPSDVVVPMDVTASNVTVLLPRAMPVDVRADMTMGNLNEGTDHRGGITSRESSYNTDRPGARLILQIDGTVSNITIQEGN
jgi:phage shock protein PspC (stress-responsive transcriptional regulator)